MHVFGVLEGARDKPQARTCKLQAERSGIKSFTCEAAALTPLHISLGLGDKSITIYIVTDT